MGRTKLQKVMAKRSRVQRPRQSLMRRLKTLFALSILCILIGVASAAIYAVVVFVQVSRTVPAVTEIGNYTPDEPTKLYYADLDESGRPRLLATLATMNRTQVKLGQMSKHLQNATIAIEDQRFWTHSGVDYYGIGRAIFRNVRGGEVRQGASTITQQLARNVTEFGLTREKAMRRKIAEAIIARRLEQSYTKREILELYLNIIYYGNTAYGAEAASRAYFRKSAKDLTLSEAAFLAGMPQRPSKYQDNMNAAMRRRNMVLDRMLEQGMITSAQHSRARSIALRTRKALVRGQQVYGAPYFVNYVVSRLVREYGSDKTYSGIHVFTSLDSRIQATAEQELRDGVDRYGGSANQACLVCMENKTGLIRAMVGGLDYQRDQFNIVTQGHRQPGSAFKPIVYTAAIDSGGCDLETTFRDDTDFPWRGRDKWIPKNYNGSYSYSNVTVLYAIKKSLNTIAVKAAMKAGVRTVIDYAKRMGITTEMAPYPPLALGASAVRPLDLCVAYSTFANEGKRAVPACFSRINERNGDIFDEPPSQLVDTNIRLNTIQQMNQALEEVVKHGTATAASGVPEARGKTGTTSDNLDAWFAGYTPELTTVIWVAREQRGKRGIRYLAMPGATGGHVCAPIWRNFMLKAIPLQKQATQSALERAASNPAGQETEPPPKAKTPDVPPIAIPGDNGEDPGAGVDPLVQPDEGIPSGPIEVPSAPRPDERGATPPPAASQPRPDPADDIVTVRICADTDRRASDYCPVTISRKMARRDTPRVCRAHGPER